jgi:hypothetical protein
MDVVQEEEEEEKKRKRKKHVLLPRIEIRFLSCRRFVTSFETFQNCIIALE